MIIVINGAAGSGKTTFAEMCCAQVTPFGLNVSTVDFVKHLATECGWDGTKTAANRKFLSNLKQLLVEWGDVPYHKTIEAIEQWERGMAAYGVENPDTMVFVHCREPEEITKFVERNGARAPCASFVLTWKGSLPPTHRMRTSGISSMMMSSRTMAPLRS